MDDDLELLERLRRGDEKAFVTLVRKYHGSMLKIAGSYVPNQAVAEEVVQDAWVGVLHGLDRFQGRSSFKTWLFQILVNRARSAGVREHRSVPMDHPGPGVDPSRFDETGQWISPPAQWVEDADDRLHAQRLARAIRTALEKLPVRQRQVVTLRDVEGLTSEEVCDVLGITEANQRVLLHRGRSRLRQALEDEFGKIQR